MGTERSFLFLQDWGVFLILAKELGDSNNRSAKEGAPEIYTLHPRACVYARNHNAWRSGCPLPSALCSGFTPKVRTLLVMSPKTADRPSWYALRLSRLAGLRHEDWSKEGASLSFSRRLRSVLDRRCWDTLKLFTALLGMKRSGVVVRIPFPRRVGVTAVVFKRNWRPGDLKVNGVSLEQSI